MPAPAVDRKPYADQLEDLSTAIDPEQLAAWIAELKPLADDMNMPEEPALQYTILLGIALLRSGETAEAARYFQEAHKVSHDPEHLLASAMALIEGRQHAAAEPILKNLVKMGHGTSLVLSSLGSLLASTGRREEAEKVADISFKAADLNNRRHLYALATQSAALDRLEQATIFFALFLSLKEGWNASAREAVGRLFERGIGDRDLPMAPRLASLLRTVIEDEEVRELVLEAAAQLDQAEDIVAEVHEEVDPKLMEQLEQLRAMEDGWDGEGAPKPSNAAVKWVRDLLPLLHGGDPSRTRISADVNGGAGIWLYASDLHAKTGRRRAAWFSRSNEGLACAVLSHQAPGTKSEGIVLTPENRGELIDRAAAFLAGAS